ncbi:atypical kinase COQ8B, mitochondrial [Cloeon dipterum]|uniref:atypical kinase COQ8B, mitochondrial n=1 Tax=Cloeon dipterum TaxID=197152 RepID=UPI00321FFB0C
MALGKDVAALMRGLQLVAKEAAKLGEAECARRLENSSIRALLNTEGKKLSQCLAEAVSTPNLQDRIGKAAVETAERSQMVVEGLRAMASHYAGKPYTASGGAAQSLESLQGFKIPDDPFGTFQESFEKITPVKNEVKKDERIVKRTPPKPVEEEPKVPNIQKQSVKTKPKVKTTLSENAKQRAVPSTRIGRLISFGSLAAGLGVGTVAEASRRALGLAEKSGPVLDASSFLSEANAERIVNTLCKVRGAALKIGQILSIQDNSIISPQLQKAFERVRQSADFMPTWQVEKVLASEFGSDWRSKVASFETKPFAAASIGQVHLATLHDGTDVAMKIQYPGVAKGIESDIDNLVSLLKVWKIFPEGLFIDNLVEVAKRELAWEVDYEREAQCTKRYREMMAPYPEYVVPNVVDELCTKQIFTSELISGVPVDQCVNMDEETRKRIAMLIMELTLKELFEFRYMQTDPNWSNFFYDPDTGRLCLLDFGATREYDKAFMDMYIQVIKSAADGDREGVLKMSQAMGFLTGYESKAMENAHVDTVMILGETFRSDEPFNFGRQNTTRRVQSQVPTMLAHRLCPPPEQIYSLHRKLSGVFLLCAKLNVAISCRPMLQRVWLDYRFG